MRVYVRLCKLTQTAKIHNTYNVCNYALIAYTSSSMGEFKQTSQKSHRIFIMRRIAVVMSLYCAFLTGFEVQSTRNVR